MLGLSTSINLVATYAQNICANWPKSVICEDKRALDINTSSPIDSFEYGFQCNDFSIINEKKGFDGHFGSLYSYGVNIINKFMPKTFFAENVCGNLNLILPRPPSITQQ